MNLDRHLIKNGPFDPDAMSVADAKAAYFTFRVAEGWADATSAKLLTWPGENMKYDKTDLPIVGVGLAPADISGVNVCQFSTADCRKGCVAYSGNGRYPQTIRGRITKTRFLAENPQAFVTLLDAEIALASKRYGGAFGVRLNTFSDLRWELIAPALFTRHAVTFYDYTKNPNRVAPDNYRLTFSLSEKNGAKFDAALARYGSAAVVFATKRAAELPSTFRGIPVIDGDKRDDRANDPDGVIVGLRAKGKMMRGNWKMVQPVA